MVDSWSRAGAGAGVIDSPGPIQGVIFAVQGDETGSLQGEGGTIPPWASYGSGVLGKIQVGKPGPGTLLRPPYTPGHRTGVPGFVISSLRSKEKINWRCGILAFSHKGKKRGAQLSGPP